MNPAATLRPMLMAGAAAPRAPSSRAPSSRATSAARLGSVPTFSAGRRALAAKQPSLTPRRARHAGIPLAKASSSSNVNASVVVEEVAKASNDPRPYLAERTEKFNWVKNWYPVSFTEYMDTEYPVPFQLLGYNLVFWQDNEDEWKCVLDACPHRLAPLSEGRVNEEGEIECGYHGWTFKGDGECTTIPQGEGRTQGLGARACATALPVKVAQGMIFVWADPASAEEAEETPLPLIEEYDDPDWVVINMQRDLPYDATTLLENTLDVSHVPFTHHATMSKRSTACRVDLEIMDRLTHGFTGRWQQGPRGGALGPQTTQFHAPSMMRHRVDYNSGALSAMTVTYATPLAPGKCRLMARFPFKFPNKIIAFVFKLTSHPLWGWTQHINQNTILEDDQIFLHWQERFAEQTTRSTGKDTLQQYYMPTTADAFVLSYLKWIKEEAGGGPTWAPGIKTELPPGEEVRANLLDRYESHVKSCPTCKGGLKNIKRGRIALLAAAAAAATAAATVMGCALALQLQASAAAAAAASTGMKAMLPAVLKSGAMWLALAVGCVAGWFRLGVTERALLQGPYPPKRNMKKFSKGKYA
eukprot:CAMPEP_0182866980 /NCGR_PEP_ID=MMETSP0034_2-20130328/8479_1 /TAXON_ID=156128 /ORGANISM="Nephroselmis pyriformis, Strain CCMP717" /LENGTH=584 /DNA_ID=CAMNT_0024999313 /DNA_START=116 /DNA_END=1870 /DNA_ORIENTATION=-